MNSRGNRRIGFWTEAELSLSLNMSKDINNMEKFSARRKNLHASLLMFFFKNTVTLPALLGLALAPPHSLQMEQ